MDPGFRLQKGGHSTFSREKAECPPFLGFFGLFVRSAMRLAYSADQEVYDVGFRVVCEAVNDVDVAEVGQ